MRLKLLLKIAAFCIPVWSYAQCGPGTPTFNVDLTGNPTAVWTSPSVVRDDNCCGTTNPDRCIKFVITLDSAAVGIVFNIVSGAVPPGALFYQIACGPPQAVGEPLCLSGVGPHILTFCKPGSNQNIYEISSIPPATGGNNVVVDKGCSHTLHATGYDSTTVVWTSIFPGAPGTYNSYLSCTSGCLSPVVSAGTGTPPPYVDYMICGKSLAPCNTQTICDTLRVTFNPPLVVMINPAIPTICFGQTSITLTANASGGTPPYSYLWNNINTAQSINAGAGTYVVSVSDASGCPSATTSVTVTSFSVAISANAGPDDTICVQNPVAVLNASVQGASGGIWSGGAGTFSPNNTTLSGVTYTPTAAEIAAGCLTLTLTTTGNGTCPPASDAVQLCFIGFTGTVNLTPVDVSCYGGNNGSASASVSGGISPYSYLWNTGATTTTITGLTPGTYSVTVQNGIGCTTQSVVAIGQPTPLAINTSNTNVTCFGGSNATLSASAVGGTPGYTYLWSPGGQTTTSMSNLTAGSYTLATTDNNGCQFLNVVTITQPSQLTVTVSPVNVSCFNGNNGSISSTVTGGLPVYSYNWSPISATAPNVSGLTAGAYTLTVTDSKGCSQTATTSITQPTVLSATVAVTPETCSYSNNGTASASVSGGTAAYSYNWQPGGQLSSSVSNLAAGNYTVTVTDQKGCSTYTVITVAQPLALSVTFINQSNVSCVGGSNGAVTANTSGGTPGYIYSWSPGGQTTGTAGNLSAGSYTFTATDTKGCLTQSVVVITQPALPLTVAATSTAVSCGGGSNGIVSASASGGTSGYSYSWQPGNYIGQTVSNVTAGTYTVTAVDTKGCTATKTVTVTQPTPVNLNTNSVPAACSSANGIASVTATGGSSPYTYLWTPTGQSTSAATGLFAGSYTATVTDANGCSATVIGNVSNSSGPTASIPSSTNVNCFGGATGSATASASSGSLPYTFVWNTAPQQSTAIASGLDAGDYVVTVIDGTGCKSLASITITEPTQVLPIVSTGSVSCFGGSGGSASVSASGGTPNYTYTWLPGGSTGSSVSGLTANTYTVQAADANACMQTATFVITQPVALTSTITPFTNVSCYGGSDGSATASVSGGTPFYNYNWTPTGANGPTVAGLTAGTYTVYISDSQGCTHSSTVAITQPAQPLSANSSSANVQCFGSASGTATVTPSGGTPGYTYLWNPSGGSGQTASGLISGNYDILVTDQNGCQTNTSVFVSQLPAINGALFPVQPSCGLPNGSITSQVSGGNGPYTYSWSPGSFTGSSISAVGPATYTLFVSDAAGCTAAFTTTLNNVPGPDAAISTISHVSCFGGNNGTATVSITQGTPPYNITWSPYGGNGLTASSLIAGTYTANVTDALGCTTFVFATITQPVAVNVSASPIDPVSCFGGSNGAATASASGGTPPYSYAWSTGQTTASVGNLSAGTYTVIVTDSKGCMATTVANVTQPSTPLSVSTSSIINPICFGGAGSATAVPAGGSVPYFYSWSVTPVQTGSTATNLTSGTYTVVITDDNGCTASDTAVITQPAQVITTAGPNYTVCINSSVTFTANATGGSGSYYYLWQPSGLINSGVLNVTPTVSTTYTVYAYDMNGCPGMAETVTATVYSLTGANVQVTAYSPICPGQSSVIYVQTTGSTGPLTYAWTPNLGTGPGAYVVTPTQAPATYSVTVTNSCGVSVTNAVQILFNPPPSVFASADPTSSCLPVVVNFSDSSFSGNPADTISSWLWNFGDGTTSTLQNPVHTYTQAGTYVVWLSVTTYGGCENNNSSTPIIITGYPSPTALFTTNPSVNPMGSHTINFINQSTGAVSYWWDFGDGSTSNAQSPQHYYPALGTYTVTLAVTNEYGCKDTFRIETLGDGEITFPNAFTPNQDGPNGGGYNPYNLDNDVFFPFAGGVKEFHMMIFNRWGELIFETFDIKIGWDGYYRGVLCQQEVYVWKAEVTFISDKKVQKTGDVTLLR